MSKILNNLCITWFSDLASQWILCWTCILFSTSKSERNKDKIDYRQRKSCSHWSKRKWMQLRFTCYKRQQTVLTLRPLTFSLNTRALMYASVFGETLVKTQGLPHFFTHVYQFAMSGKNHIKKTNSYDLTRYIVWNVLQI